MNGTARSVNRIRGMGHLYRVWADGTIVNRATNQVMGFIIQDHEIDDALSLNGKPLDQFLRKYI